MAPVTTATRPVRSNGSRPGPSRTSFRLPGRALGGLDHGQSVAAGIQGNTVVRLEPGEHRQDVTHLVQEHLVTLEAGGGRERLRHILVPASHDQEAAGALPVHHAVLADDHEAATGRPLQVVHVDLDERSLGGGVEHRGHVLDVDLELAPVAGRAEDVLREAEEPSRQVDVVDEREHHAPAQVRPRAVTLPVVLPWVEIGQVLADEESGRERPADLPGVEELLGLHDGRMKTQRVADERGHICRDCTRSSSCVDTTGAPRRAVSRRTQAPWRRPRPWRSRDGGRSGS